jgi:excisionase family DNA binding protein
MIYNRLLTIGDVADYLQMSDDFVEREIHLDNIDAIHIGDDWRIEPSAVVDYIEPRRTHCHVCSPEDTYGPSSRQAVSVDRPRTLTTQPDMR